LGWSRKRIEKGIGNFPTSHHEGVGRSGTNFGVSFERGTTSHLETGWSGEHKKKGAYSWLKQTFFPEKV